DGRHDKPRRGFFDILSPFCPPTTLETLKYDDTLQGIAEKLVHSIPDLSALERAGLIEFFCLTLTRNPENRTLDIGKLLAILCEERLRCKLQL
ncbi:hypothetical protein BDD12DRAFT_912479, partial [Trichophaea hybrida]